MFTSSFNTVLAVFEYSQGLRSLVLLGASDDTSTTDPTSCVTVSVGKRATVAVMVGGKNGDMGDIVLTTSLW